MSIYADSINASWSAIDTWLAEHAPDVLMQGPAKAESVQMTEQILGVLLPADFKDSLQIHDGQRMGGSNFVEASEFLSLERIVDEWKVWKDLLDGGDFAGITSDPSGPIKNDWWNARWIPFTYDGSGNHLCLDLDPAAGGNVGQVISMWHDDAERKVIASSFGEWLSQVTKSLHNGDLVFSEDFGGIVPKDDA